MFARRSFLQETGSRVKGVISKEHGGNKRIGRMFLQAQSNHPSLTMNDLKSQNSLISSVILLVIVGFLLFLLIAIGDILRLSAIEDLKLETRQCQCLNIDIAWLRRRAFKQAIVRAIRDHSIVHRPL
jgi:hypothetical protein